MPGGPTHTWRKNRLLCCGHRGGMRRGPDSSARSACRLRSWDAWTANCAGSIPHLWARPSSRRRRSSLVRSQRQRSRGPGPTPTRPCQRPPAASITGWERLPWGQEIVTLTEDTVFTLTCVNGTGSDRRKPRSRQRQLRCHRRSPRSMRRLLQPLWVLQPLSPGPGPTPTPPRPRPPAPSTTVWAPSPAARPPRHIE